MNYFKVVAVTFDDENQPKTIIVKGNLSFFDANDVKAIYEEENPEAAVFVVEQ